MNPFGCRVFKYDRHWGWNTRRIICIHFISQRVATGGFIPLSVTLFASLLVTLLKVHTLYTPPAFSL